MAEWVCGKFPWPIPGRMLEPGTTVDADGSPGGGGRLPAEIQSGATAQSAGLRKPGHVCGAELSIPSFVRAAPSLRWGWTKNRQKHKLKTSPRLTLLMDLIVEPGQNIRAGGGRRPEIHILTFYKTYPVSYIEKKAGARQRCPS